MKNNVWYISVWYILLLAGCRGCYHEPTRKERMTDDVTTSGIIYVAADESYRYILDQEKEIFEYFYPHAEIHLLYSDEKTAFERALNDSVRLVVASTPDNNKMNKYLRDRHMQKRVIHVASDGIAVVVNKKCPVKKLRVHHLVGILSGRIRHWNQVSDTLPRSPIHVYYDSQRSGTARYIAERFLNGSGTLVGKAADSTFQLLEWIEKDEAGIGLIGFGFMSDYHDARTKQLGQRVNVLAMSQSNDSTLFCLPSQTTIADTTYPLIRKMLILNKEGKTGLGTGFASFIAGPKGQKILLKAGMLPKQIPARNIEIVVE